MYLLSIVGIGANGSDGAETGSAAASHHAHHGLRPAAVPAQNAAARLRPAQQQPEAVLERVAQAHGQCHLPAGVFFLVTKKNSRTKSFFVISDVEKM